MVSVSAWVLEQQDSHGAWIKRITESTNPFKINLGLTGFELRTHDFCLLIRRMGFDVTDHMNFL